MEDDRPTVDFDHHSDVHVGSWPEVTAAARDVCPVAWTPHNGGQWLLTGYDEVRTVTHDTERFQSGRVDGVSSMYFPSTPVPLIPLEADDPLHLQLRRALNPVFTPKMAAMWEPFVEQLTDALLDRIVGSGEGDLVRQLAKPVAAAVNLVLVGLPGDDNELYIDAAGIMVREQAGSPLFEAALAEVKRMEHAIHDLLEDRRRSPRDDLATVIAHIEVDGELAPFDLLHNLLETVVSGGVSTTVSLMAHSLMWLPEDRSERARLAADRDALSQAITEYLRLCTPATNLGRLCRGATELAGQRITPGEHVMLSYAGANRDPKMFANPDEIDIERPNADKHLSFGTGRHRCLGMYVAMTIAETVVRRVLQRLPDFRVDRDKVVRYPRIPAVNGVLSMPATFTPSSSVGATIPTEGPPLPDRVRVY